MDQFTAKARARDAMVAMLAESSTSVAAAQILLYEPFDQSLPPAPVVEAQSAPTAPVSSSTKK